jgi:hypothetical protein
VKSGIADGKQKSACNVKEKHVALEDESEDEREEGEDDEV